MKWEIIHIPGKPPSTLDQSTVDVLASTIKPKLANVLVRKLNQICPLEHLRHVKRVRRRSLEGNIELSVILCLSNGLDNHMEGLSEDLLQLIRVHELKPFKAKVAQFAAMSKEEWEEQCTLWPTSFHPPHNLEHVVGFSDEDSQLIVDYMKIAIQSTKSNCLVGKVVNAAVIVDPLSRQIIASAIDETCQSSVSDTEGTFKRCTELSEILSSSRSDENGLVECHKNFSSKPSGDECSSLSTEPSCLCPWGWRTQRQHTENNIEKCTGYGTWHPLRHAALVAIEKAAARDRQLFPGSGSSEVRSCCNYGLPDPSNSSPAKRQKTNNAKDILVNGEQDDGSPSASLRPYLCTGFDMYLAWEPCTMCAMALVHQRIRRIFYAFPNPNAGALGSVYRLQGEKSLNHHYSVYRVLVPGKALHDENLNGFDYSSC